MGKTDRSNSMISLGISRWLDGYRNTADAPCLLFVSGAQGIGKSTALAQIEENSGEHILTLSLDDFYLSRKERQILAETVHPLFETRGPPGTHDLELLNQTIDALLSASETSITELPTFDKCTDDRAPQSAWRSIHGCPNVIIIEGWMMGVLPDLDAPRAQPINVIEASDEHGDWQRYQEEALAENYASLWDRADGFLHLDAPCFETVLNWRLEQERSNLGEPFGPLSSERTEWVTRFILHYERLTRRMLAGGRRDGARLRIGKSRNVMLDE